MSIDDKLSYEEMKSNVVNGDVIGEKNKLIVTVSFPDLYKRGLKPTYMDAVEFAKKYLIPGYDAAQLIRHQKILSDHEQKHDYDNAWRLVLFKQPYGNYC